MTPVHVYICPKCSYEIDVEFSYNALEADEVPMCPRCRIPMHRSWNDTPVIFKGKGFYKNDSKKETNS